MLKIAVDAGDFCPGKSPVKSGITRIVNSFHNQIRKAEYQRIQFTFYYFGSIKSHIRGNIHYVRLPKRGFASLFLPLKAILDQSDVFIGLSSYIPQVLRYFSLKKLVFIYDFGFDEFPKFYRDARTLQKKIIISVKRADQIIITNSDSYQIVKNYAGTQKNIHVLYPGTDHLPDSSQKINEKYFLFVGVIKPSKNIEKLLAYFDAYISSSDDLYTKLILIGEDELSYAKELKQLSIFKKIKKRIKHINSVSDRELSIYYKNAIAVLNFSYVEGFAFPVLEALRFNTPMIVNNLRIYKDYKKTYSNLHISFSKSEAIRLMKYASKINSKRKKILKNSFSWKQFTDQLLKISVS